MLNKIRVLLLLVTLTIICSSCGRVRSTAYTKPLVIRCPSSVMEPPALPPYPTSKKAVKIITEDDPVILGSSEELYAKLKASDECWKKLEEAGILRKVEERTDGK